MQKVGVIQIKSTAENETSSLHPTLFNPLSLSHLFLFSPTFHNTKATQPPPRSLYVLPFIPASRSHHLQYTQTETDPVRQRDTRTCKRTSLRGHNRSTGEASEPEYRRSHHHENGWINFYSRGFCIHTARCVVLFPIVNRQRYGHDHVSRNPFRQIVLCVTSSLLPSRVHEPLTVFM